MDYPHIIRTIAKSADKNHGVTLAPLQVRELAGYIADLIGKLNNISLLYHNLRGMMVEELGEDVVDGQLVLSEVFENDSGVETFGHDGLVPSQDGEERAGSHEEGETA